MYHVKIYGIIPSLTQEDAHNICRHATNSMLNCFISKFKKGELKWVMEAEVCIVQFLDILVAVPVASYHLEKTGDSNDVKLRIEEVLVYVQPFETVFSTVLRMVKYQFARPNVKNALTLKTFVKAI